MGYQQYTEEKHPELAKFIDQAVQDGRLSPMDFVHDFLVKLSALLSAPPLDEDASPEATLAKLEAYLPKEEPNETN